MERAFIGSSSVGCMSGDPGDPQPREKQDLMTCPWNMLSWNCPHTRISSEPVPGIRRTVEHLSSSAAQHTLNVPHQLLLRSHGPLMQTLFIGLSEREPYCHDWV